MASLSRRIFSEGKRFKTVIFKENTNPGDFEVVELQDIQNAERAGLAKEMINDGFILNGFKAVGSGLSNAVKITVGTGFSQGERLILPDLLHQLVSGEHVFNMAIATPVVDRTDLVYIDIFDDVVTSVTDADLLEPSLGPTADRERLRYVFRVSENSTTVPTLPVGHRGEPIAEITRRAGDAAINAADVKDARNLASLNSQFRPQNLIIVSPQGGDFNNPQDALNSVSASSESNPFTILIRPGQYTIDTPLNFVNPYVAMIGEDPNSCSILINTSGGSGATINADRIVLKNMRLGFNPGSGPHFATVLVNGSFDVVLDSLILSKDHFDENEVNSFHGIDTTAGGTVTVRQCKVFSQSAGPSAAVINGPSSIMIMDECDVVAANSDALSNSGTMTIRRSTFVGTKVLITSSGPITASETSWINQVISPKAFTVTAGTNMTLTGSVQNKMTRCVIEPDGNDSSMVDTSAIWSDVKVGAKFFTSGGGVSSYRNCEFTGIDINGSTVDLDNCLFGLASSSWGIPGVSGLVGIITRGATTTRVSGCRSRASTVVHISGANPLFKDCHFQSNVDGARVFVITSASAPVIDNCMIELLVGYAASAAPIHVIDAGSDITLVHSHLQGSALGQPSWFVAGNLAGTKLRKGRNTGSAGALVDVTTVTVVTDLELN